MATNKVWQNLHLKENLLGKKLKQKCIWDGNSNLRFHHSMMNSRKRRNNILALNTNRGRVDQVEEIKLKIKITS